MRSLDTVAQLEDLDAVTERRSKKTTTINTERMTIKRFFLCALYKYQDLLHHPIFDEPLLCAHDLLIYVTHAVTLPSDGVESVSEVSQTRNDVAVEWLACALVGANFHTSSRRGPRNVRSAKCLKRCVEVR
jgi:hypothetical protein